MRRVLILAGPLLVAALLPGRMALAGAQAQSSARATLRELEAAVERDPGNPSLQVALGVAYLERNETAQALLVLRKAVLVGPRSAEAHNWLGVALAAKSDLPGAIAAFRKAIALDPQHGRAYSNLGSALAKS
ncbi:MAG TPA: tetratricopeptide repeat protein, partial [Vicinamibacteria bacterium]